VETEAEAEAGRWQSLSHGSGAPCFHLSLCFFGAAHARLQLRRRRRRQRPATPSLAPPLSPQAVAGFGRPPAPAGALSLLAINPAGRQPRQRLARTPSRHVAGRRRPAPSGTSPGSRSSSLRLWRTCILTTARCSPRPRCSKPPRRSTLPACGCCALLRPKCQNNRQPLSLPNAPPPAPALSLHSTPLFVRQPRRRLVRAPARHVAGRRRPAPRQPLSLPHAPPPAPALSLHSTPLFVRQPRRRLVRAPARHV
jgi:hypothetical protein